ncbi:hypothetical protein BS78_01G042500 [Paspalum vaginatum]|nr:hypothetical protein BS78_01G042500 [Paspalum vaginatum]
MRPFQTQIRRRDPRGGTRVRAVRLPPPSILRSAPPRTRKRGELGAAACGWARVSIHDGAAGVGGVGGAGLGGGVAARGVQPGDAPARPRPRSHLLRAAPPPRAPRRLPLRPLPPRAHPRPAPPPPPPPLPRPHPSGNCAAPFHLLLLLLLVFV